MFVFLYLADKSTLNVLHRRNNLLELYQVNNCAKTSIFAKKLSDFLHSFSFPENTFTLHFLKAMKK